MTTSQRSTLPQHVRPLKYRITLAPDLEQFTFSGEETIDIEAAQPTSEIVLNAVEIQVQAASVILGNGATIAADRTEYDESKETVTFFFGSQLPKGQMQLSLQFTGILNDRLHGFYRSTYRGADGTERTLAATQFEPTDARHAFPCWDEPALKATFDTTLVIPSHLTAVSNTPIISEEPTDSATKRIQFQETPPMSTYLLAFIVGELEYVEDKSSDGTTIRVWTTPGKAAQGRLALDVATRLLSYYNDYFGIPYPLDKLDHLAIPDFAAGAMENWGAITYREMALLFDTENSSPGTRQRIAEIVAHEMAHMWFGDLVTMDWWNDLWLNESFASWMATKAVDYLFPEWDLWTQFIVDDVNSGLSLDGLENSHPIEAEVRNPAEIQELFDPISYSKGASLIRMLEQFIGPEQFRKGLQRYLSSHLYGNARTQDLWEAMSEESDQPVTAIMDTWIRQTGYPVVQADIQRKTDEVNVHLTQQRFLYTGPNQDPTLWMVPVRISAPGGVESKAEVLDTRKGVVTLKEAQPQGMSSWVKVNPLHTGFYRVQYNEEEWPRFTSAIESLELPAADRLGLQGDAYALSQACLIPATQFLTLAQAYHNEKEYSVWADLCANLRRFNFLLSQEPYHARFQTFGQELLRPIAQKVGWNPIPGEGHLQTLLRSVVLSQLGSFRDQETLSAARHRFERFLKEPSSLSPDLRGVVYNLTAQAGDGATHDTLRRLAREATLQEEKVRLHIALTQFQDPALLEKTLDMSLSSEVRTQDTVGLVGAVAANPKSGTQAAWKFVKGNWPEFFRRYGSGGFAIMRLVGITGNFSTQEARADVEEFFQRNPTPSAARTVQQSLERIGLNIRWLERNRTELAQWFGG